MVSLGLVGFSRPKPKPLNPHLTATPVALNDSLKVKLVWTQPTDGFGNADSITYRLKISKPWIIYGDTIVRQVNVWVKRKRTTQLADSLKLSRGLPGDTVTFQADSIRQCRKGVCSVPGSAAFQSIRPLNPPPPTSFQVVTDSF